MKQTLPGSSHNNISTLSVLHEHEQEVKDQTKHVMRNVTEKAADLAEPLATERNCILVPLLASVVLQSVLVVRDSCTWTCRDGLVQFKRGGCLACGCLNTIVLFVIINVDDACTTSEHIAWGVSYTVVAPGQCHVVVVRGRCRKRCRKQFHRFLQALRRCSSTMYTPELSTSIL